MKKWIGLILCLALVVVFALPAEAEGETKFTITADKTELQRGDTVTFTVTISASQPCTSFGLVLSYNEAVYEIVEGSCSVAGATTQNFSKEGKIFSVLFESVTVPSGNVGSFTLKVKADAPIAVASVSAASSVKNGDEVVPSVVGSADVSVVCVHVYDTDCDEYCNLCNAQRTVNHNWDEGQQTAAPGCTTPGSKTFVCKTCGATKTEEIPAQHTYDNGCDTDCNLCGATREAQHTWNSGTVTLEPGCTTPGTLTYTCSVCGTTKEETLAPAHKYEGDWQTDGDGHWLVCACGAVSPKEGHAYGDAWESDGENHWKSCTDCGYQSKAAHTPGAEATEFTNQVCTTCDRVLKWATHQHTYGDDWFRDDRGHGHPCTVCNRVAETEKHVYDSDCDPDCSVCGYTRIPQHIYSERWSSDTNGHWHACELCNEGLEIEAHVPGPEATLTTPQICLTCGYEIAPSLGHTHKYDGAWKKNAESHWKECSCGMTSVKGEHNWDAGVVTREPTSTVVGRMTYTCLDCGEKKTVSIEHTGSDIDPNSQNAAEKPGFPWWLIVIVVAIPVVALGTYVVVGVIGGKKQEGRFTEKDEV